MNDRFKFRVWDKPLEKYMEFKEFKFMNVEFTFNPITKEAEIEYDKERYIVEQCTGLKDKNGKLIYENDYVENDNTKDDVYLVVFHRETARFVAKEMNGNLRLINKNVRVVGNIHEKEEQ